MIEKFNKVLLGRNIRFLAQLHNAKLGELEETSGVSVGYISRLLKSEDGGSSALLDLALCSSEKFGISLECLLKTDLSAYLPNEQYLAKFFYRLQEQTEKGLLNWEFLPRAKIEGDGQSCYPRMEWDAAWERSVYQSAFNPENGLGEAVVTAVFGEKGQSVYIPQVVWKNLDSVGYEVYVGKTAKSYEVQPICCVFQKDKLFQSVDGLFKSASETSHQLQIQPEIRHVLDAYLGKFEKNTSTVSAEDDSDDLPF